MANHEVKMIFVDRGSLVEVIILDLLAKLGISKEVSPQTREQTSSVSTIASPL